MVKPILVQLGFYLTTYTYPNNLAFLLFSIPEDYITPKPNSRDVNKYTLVSGYDISTNQIIPLNKELFALANRNTEIDYYADFKGYTDDNWQFYQMYTAYLNRVYIPFNDIWLILQQIRPWEYMYSLDSLLAWHFFIMRTVYDQQGDENFALVDQYVKSRNFTYNYFNVVNPTQPENQAALNQVNLDFNTFENGLQFLAMEQQESILLQGNMLYDSYDPFNKLSGVPRREDGYGLNFMSGWSKDKLLQAIIASGLVTAIPIEKQRRIIDEKTIGSITKFKLIRGIEGQTSVHRFKRTRSGPDAAQKMQRELYLYNNEINLTKLGIPIPTNYGDTTSLLNIYANKNMLGIIYRRIYGTIYTINWQEYCRLPQMAFMPSATLQNILDVYYGKSFNVDPKMIMCNAIVQSTPRVKSLMDSVQNVEQWTGYLLQQYQNSETFAINQSKTKGKRGVEQDDESEGKRRRE